MAISLRPFWTPREVSAITVLLIYAAVFETTPVNVVKETVKTINHQIDALEKVNPNSTIIALGDLNHIIINSLASTSRSLVQLGSQKHLISVI